MKSYAQCLSTGSRDLRSAVLDLITSTPSFLAILYIPVEALALTASFITMMAIFAVSTGTKILMQGNVLMPGQIRMPDSHRCFSEKWFRRMYLLIRCIVISYRLSLVSNHSWVESGREKYRAQLKSAVELEAMAPVFVWVAWEI